MAGVTFYKAQMTFWGPGVNTSVHDRYFKSKDHAIQSFKNIVRSRAQDAVFSDRTKSPYEYVTAAEGEKKIAEVSVLEIPLYDAARTSLEF